MRLLIYTPDFPWSGGIDLLHGMVKGLQNQRKVDCEIYLLVRQNEVLVRKTSLIFSLKRVIKAVIRLIKNPAGIKNIFFKLFPVKADGAGKKGDGYDYLDNLSDVFSKENVRFIYINDLSEASLNAVFAEVKPDVIFPVLSGSANSFYPYPWVGYLFDFVYRYHAHLYTKEFRDNMDAQYLKTLTNANSVIVNSRSVYKDVIKFYPALNSHVFSLPFAPYTNEGLYQESKMNDDVLKQYGISSRYFMVCNQFWLHKSHETAFEALKIILEKSKDKNISILCTGRMTDLSGTDNRMLQLTNYISNLGLNKNIVFLGHISKKDQLSLMLRCVAVLQPTLFEGGPGGGSVYMAVANGVPSIVSDIEVNLEIGEEPLVTFFKTGDPEDLALKMGSYLEKDREILNYSTYKKKNDARLEKLGDRLIESFEHAIADNKKLKEHRAKEMEFSPAAEMNSPDLKASNRIA